MPDLEIREVRRGSKPGSRYVRVQRRQERRFERLVGGEYRATEIALRPRTPLERAWRGLKRVLVGPPLATSDLSGERLSRTKALAIFASDNLSSSAYATEEMLIVLILAGTAALTWSVPIALAIVLLTGLVALSYSQVIRGYPNGGGAYVVAKENLGLWPGWVAGASLIADYVLLVAVSVAAGIAAITSALPELHPYRVELAIAAVVLITLMNLRGVRESASFFAIPTYFFVVTFAGLLITGFVRLALGHDLTAASGHGIEPAGQAVTLFLILRAFSSGSAALTGVEAVSNGVPSMKPPESRNATVVLTVMVVILGAFFLGTSILAHQLGVVPSESKTVVAQIAETELGNGVLFYVVQLATMLILILAANTSFAGLPSLASVMARDRALPRAFAMRGDRLAFSNGIIVLGLASIGLLVAFQADTHRLIPLYAVGVFVGFTLSQLGLVRHWRREPAPGSKMSQVINATGAVITGVVTVIVALTKFSGGAWITIAGIAVLTFAFSRIHHHYARASEQLAVADPPPPGRRGRVVLVPVGAIGRAALRTVEYGRIISPNVTAVHVIDDVSRADAFRAEWQTVAPDTPLIIIESFGGSLVAPIVAYVDAVASSKPGAYVTVVMPEFVPDHVWEGLLHNRSAAGIRKALRRRNDTILVNVPYRLGA